MSLVKNQHYVPQFYLQHFTKSGDQICVCDKFTTEEFHSNIRNIASSSYFYDLSLDNVNELNELIQSERAKETFDPETIEGLLKQIEDVQMVEKYLSRLEGRFERVMHKVIEGLEHRRRFKSEYRSEIALMAAVQFWRTRERREEMLEMEQKLEQSVMAMVQKLNESQGTNYSLQDVEPNIAFDPEETATRHKMMVFDRELIETTAKILNNHIWMIGVNETNNPFFTSDNPVTTYAHKTDDWRSNTGIASPGAEVIFPLTPKYILLMIERSYFPMLERQDGHLIYSKLDQVTFYNSRQVYSSYRQVYSKMDNFQLIREMLEKEPDLETPRPRWGTPFTG